MKQTPIRLSAILAFMVACSLLLFVLSPALADVDDSYSVSLLHMNGADASTTFTDESGKTWTAAGNAQIDTAQLVFGSASGLFDGTGDKITAADTLDWQLDGGSNSNSWTIDFRLRFNGDPGTGNAGIVQQRADNNGLWYLALQNNKLHFGMRAAGTDYLSIENTWDPAGSTWYHVAIVKQGTTGYKFFIDGSQIGSTQTDTDPIGDIAGGISIGSVTTNLGTYELNGWLDEMRISKGIARWTANFTSPNAEYPDRTLQTQTAAAATSTAALYQTQTAAALTSTAANVLTQTAAANQTNTAVALTATAANNATQTMIAANVQTQIGVVQTWIAGHDQTQIAILSATPTLTATATITLTPTLTRTPAPGSQLQSTITYGDLGRFNALMCIASIGVLWAIAWFVKTFLMKRGRT